MLLSLLNSLIPRNVQEENGYVVCIFYAVDWNGQDIDNKVLYESCRCNAWEQVKEAGQGRKDNGFPYPWNGGPRAAERRYTGHLIQRGGVLMDEALDDIRGRGLNLSGLMGQTC